MGNLSSGIVTKEWLEAQLNMVTLSPTNRFSIYFHLFTILVFIFFFYPKIQVCNYIASKWTRVWLDDQKVPFIFHGNTMIGYDDTESIEAKVTFLLLIWIFFLSNHLNLKFQVELHNSKWLRRCYGLG